MPIHASSRYRGITPAHVPGRDGGSRAAIPARLPPAPATGGPSDLRHLVIAGETIEGLAWRYLGSSEAWWQIADANPAVFPTALPAGTTLIIPGAIAAGQVERSRTF